MDEFCGEPLWANFSRFANSGLPNVTPCFQYTALVWTPAIFFWFLFPILFWQLRIYETNRRFLTLPFHKLLITKLCLTVFAFVSSLTLFISNVIGTAPGHVHVFYPLIRALTMAGYFIGQLGCRKAGVVSSGILFNSILLHLICSLPECYSWYSRLTGSFTPLYNQWHCALFILWVFSIFSQTLIQCWADHRPVVEKGSTRNRSPELDSSFISRTTLWWFNSLPILGASKSLVTEDLFELNDENRSIHLNRLWEHYWVPKVERYYEEKRQFLADECSQTLLNEKSKTIDGINKIKPPSRPSVILTLFQMFKWQLLSTGVLRAVENCLHFMNPLLLHRLLGFVADPNAYLWEGVAYAVLMFLNSELRSLIYNYVYLLMFRMGTKIQNTLISAVYKKSLRLSNTARRDKTVGEIVNVMAIDVERFHTITHHFHAYWSTPFQVTLALILLFNTLGISALPGVFVMMSFIPVSLIASYYSRSYQQRQMRLKDERTKMINETLNGIKVVKLYAWEEPMMRTIEEIRRNELRCIRAHMFIRSALDVYNFSTPFFVALASFTTYTFLHDDNSFTPQVAFVSLALFNQLRMPMTVISQLLNLTIQIMVSNTRVKELLTSDEIDDLSIDRSPREKSETAVELNDADFAWESDSSANLRDISLNVNKGWLVAVVGRVGAGKSSLLSALLGEMEKTRGSAAVRGSIAYVPQQAWIQNMTLRSNITFGRSFDPTVYSRVIYSCALDSDLEILPNGDETEIGEKGINLSGGQKARVSLARALYQNADLYLLDDPLSAVDSHVGKHIFEKVIGDSGILRNKTRILVTHGVAFLPNADLILHMEDGRIIESGTFEELMEKGEKFAQLVAENNQKSEETEENSVEEVCLDEAPEEDEPEFEEDAADLLCRRQSTISTIISRPQITHPDSQKPKNSTKTAKLIQSETLQTGVVSKGVYWIYVRAASFLFSLLFVSLYIGYAALQLGRNLWLSAWSDDNSRVQLDNSTVIMDSKSRLGVFAAVGGIETICFTMARLALTLGGLRASRNLHNPVLRRVLRSPMSFFDTTPIGRILNRFGRDIDVVDTMLPVNFRFFLQCTTSVAATIIAICISTPFFVFVCLGLIVLYVYLLKFYVPTWRQLRRMESNSRSPIYSHFAESIQGAPTIRAFGKMDDFADLCFDRVDHFVRIKYMGMVSKPWFGVRLELLGNLVTFSAALFAALSHELGFVGSAGLVGLSVTYALSITETLNFAVRQISDLEINLVSVERLREYMELDSEADWEIATKRPPPQWPQKGAVQIRDYATRYRAGLDLVIRDISLSVGSGQKIGIVGRTGAGKSSFALALFRIIEPSNGSIIVDDVDISAIGLHDLRSRLTIIPQDPILFSGSIRFNLDPFGNHSDDELWKALETAHLRSFVAELPLMLDHPVSEGGTNISVGQRQLLCLARALLRRSKILVLDEATAAVDLLTDSLIQRTIRREFADATVFTIAHRLHTILDYDLVLVLSEGRVREFAAPGQLLADPQSIFSQMAQNANLISK